MSREFLTFWEREQLALTSAYMGLLSRGENLYTPDYVQGPRGSLTLNKDYFKKVRKNYKRKYHSLSYGPEDIPYVISYLCGRTGLQILRKLKAHQLSFLVPKIRIFKVFTNNRTGETEEVEMIYPTHEKVELLGGPTPSHLASAGLRGFEATYQGVNEAEVENNIRCRLRLFFSNVHELSRGHEIVPEEKRKRVQKIALQNWIDQHGVVAREVTGVEDALLASDTAQKAAEKKVLEMNKQWRHVDVLSPPLPNANYGRDGKATYWGDEYRIRVVFGWTVREDMADLDFAFKDLKKLKKVLEGLNRSLTLNILTHTFDLSQEGTVSIDAEYIGAVEQEASDPRYSIFAPFGPSGGRSWVADLIRARQAILDGEEHADRVRHDSSAGNLDEILTGVDNARVSYSQDLTKLSTNAFWRAFDNVARAGAPVGRPGTTAEVSWNLSEQDEDSDPFALGGRRKLDITTTPEGDPATLRAAVDVKYVKTLVFDEKLLNPYGKSGEAYGRSLHRKKFIRAMKGLAGIHSETSTDLIQVSEVAAGSKIQLGNQVLDAGKVAGLRTSAIMGLVKTKKSVLGDMEGYRGTADAPLQEQERQSLKNLQRDIAAEGVRWSLNHRVSPQPSLEVDGDEVYTYPVTFVTIGDCLQGFITRFKDKAFHKKNKILIGTLMVTRRTEAEDSADGSPVGKFMKGDNKQGKQQVWHIPIEDIPITYQNFFKWYVETIVSKERFDYTIGEFLSKGIRELAAISLRHLSELGFRNVIPGAISKIPFSIPEVLAKDVFKRRPVTGDNYVSINKVKSILTRLDGTGIESKDQVQVMFVGGRPPTESFDLDGDLLKDEKRGLKHFFVGSLSDILIAAEFQKDNLPGFRESKIKQAQGTGIGSQLVLISEPYLLTLRLVGNSIFYPGMRVYFHPSILGINKADFRLPLEGYYVIYETKDFIERGKFQTELKCRFERQASDGVHYHMTAKPTHKFFSDSRFFDRSSGAGSS